MEKIPDIINCGCRTLEFTVDGKPVPQQRPGFTFAGITYDRKMSRDYKRTVKSAAEEAVFLNNWVMAHEGMPIRVELIIYKPIPKSLPKWAKNAAVAGFTAPLKRTGDIENIAKGIMDAMSGLVYKDDAQVYNLNITMRYSEEPKVDVKVDALFVNNGDIKDAVKRRQCDEMLELH